MKGGSSRCSNSLENNELIQTCQKCTGDQKDAPMMGLTIVKGMKRNGNKYADGSILDPRDGTVYHAQMELSADGQQLSVRGYLGIPLLGQTQIWTRLPDDAIAPADIPEELRRAGVDAGVKPHRCRLERAAGSDIPRRSISRLRHIPNLMVWPDIEFLYRAIAQSGKNFE